MKLRAIIAAGCMVGAAGLAQAGTMNADLVVPSSVNNLQAGHLMNVARILLGYDSLGNPIYGHTHLPRTIIGYDQSGRPVYGHLYNNRPLFTSPDVVTTIVRPYSYDWDWGSRHWDRHAFHGDHDWHGDHGDRWHHDHD